MAATTVKDHVVNQGDTFSYPFTWLDKNRDPVNLTGYTARMQLRVSVDSTDIILELTTENDRIVLGGTEGTVLLTVDAVTMAAIAPGTYKYDLEFVSGDNVAKLLKGKFKVLPEVTK